MTGFVLGALALVVSTLLLLFRPWQRATATSANVAGDVNAGIYRDQLAELDRDLAAGTLSDPDHAQARTELQRRVLEDNSRDKPPQSAAPRGIKTTAITLAVAMPLVGALMYLALGSPQAITAQRATTREDVNNMVAGLAAKLEKNPNDTRGWIVLARSYRIMNKLPESQNAFERAGSAIDKEPVLLAEYADVLATRAMGNFDGKPLELVNKALELDANNVVALSLAATAAYNRKDLPQAISYWERLQKLVPPESEDGQWLAQALPQVRAQAASGAGSGKAMAPTALKPGAATGAAAKAEATNAQAANAQTTKPPATKEQAATVGGVEAITGRVTLSAALKDKAQPTDTVFIFARPQDSRMPLAVQRARVADLPIDFKLDDSTAMNPAAKLSSANAVRIEARISRNGSATPSPGDLFGAGPVVKPGTAKVNVEIDQVRP